MYVTMASLGSVRARSLTISVMTAESSAASSASPAPSAAALLAVSSLLPKPGCRMIITPMKPMMVAVQRRARTSSPRNSAAPAVANSGTVKLSAIALSNGSSVSDVNPQSMERRLRNDRQP